MAKMTGLPCPLIGLIAIRSVQDGQVLAGSGEPATIACRRELEGDI